MKNLLILLFILSQIFCFGQSDYVVVEGEKLNKYERKVVNPVQYNSLKNTTAVKLYSNHIINLIGKWDHFNDTKFGEEHLVSHCPILVDENNVILEFAIFDQSFHNDLTGSYSFRHYQKQYLTRYAPKNSVLISSQIDEAKKIYVYKLKSPSKFNQNNIYTSYHLIGKKNNKVYRMVIYNIDETNFENFDTFLINTFNNN